MHGLDSDEMTLISQLFQEANAFVLDSADNQVKENVISFVLNRVMNDNLSAQMTPKGFMSLRGYVFNDELVRDYIVKLCFVFFSRWAASDEKMLGLAANLSRGLTQTPYVPEPKAVSGIPAVLVERFGTREEVFNLMASNPWLMIVAMFPLFINRSAFKNAEDTFRPITGS